MQLAVEHAERHTGKRHVDPRAIRFHRATLDLIHGRRTRDFVGLPGQARLIRDARAWWWISPIRRRLREVERRVPERVPLVLIDDRRRDRHAQSLERLNLLIAHAAETGRHAKLRRHVGGQRGPGAAVRLDRQFADRWRPAGDRQPKPHLLAAIAVPRQHAAGFSRGSQSWRRLVAAHAARGRLRGDIDCAARMREAAATMAAVPSASGY